MILNITNVYIWQTSLLLCEKVLWWASEWSPFTVFSPRTQKIINYSKYKFLNNYEYKDKIIEVVNSDSFKIMIIDLK